jgi:uncharacterized protein (DUF488 family)
VVTVHTVGHSTRSLVDLVSMLRHYDVDLLVDVRDTPRSRHNPQFNAEELDADLPRYSLGYVHLPTLGGHRHTRAGSPNTGWRNLSFRGYADHMLTDDFRAGVDELVALAERWRPAIMCAEAVPWRCHRSLVADALSVRDIPVVEILSQSSHRPHKLTPFAEVHGTRVTYPPKQGTLL